MFCIQCRKFLSLRAFCTHCQVCLLTHYMTIQLITRQYFQDASTMKLEYKHEAFVFCWIKLQKDWENNNWTEWTYIWGLFLWIKIISKSLTMYKKCKNKNIYYNKVFTFQFFMIIHVNTCIRFFIFLIIHQV